MLRFAATVAVLVAAQAQLPAPPAEPTTLHAYSNLVQIPVLVVSDKHGRAAPLSPDQFSISIDSGPRFAPRHVRQEGDDAIRLIILLDRNESTRREIDTFGTALHQSIGSFTDQDMLSVSIEDGNTLLHTEAVPVLAKLEALSTTVDQMVASVSKQNTTENQFATTTSAPQNKPLWNAIAATMHQFGDTRSRRVLLVVTDGEDRGSQIKIQQVRRDADLLGVTIFALRERGADAARHDQYVLSRDSFSYARPVGEAADKLVTLTENTGGMTLETRNHPLAEGLTRILRLVRERYLVDFVRPSALPAGTHTVEVRIRRSNLLVRWSGVGVPMEDPAIATDPSTVPSDRTKEPPVGKRRVLTR